MASLREKVREELIEYWKGGFDKYKYSDDYKYYVNDINKNLIGGNMDDAHRNMFENGSGSELKDTPAKAKAIDSSSMLSYNFFRNINENCTLKIDHIEYDKVFFEVKLPTLRSSNAPANMDVVLVSKDGKDALFIESKFLEYLEYDSVDLAKSYSKDDSSYFTDNKETEALLGMSKKYENKKGLRYNYGIKQNICHLIGISNLKKSEKAKKKFAKTYEKQWNNYSAILNAENYQFMNIIFHPSFPEASQESEKYIKELDNFQKDLPSDIKKYTRSPFVMTYRNLFDLLSDQLQDKIREELENRYINFHSEKK